MVKDEVSYVIIVSVVAIVAVVSLFLNGSINGAPTYPGDGQFMEPDPVIVDRSESVAICFDEDDGYNDFFRKSYVQITNKKYYDYCQGDYVRETICTGNHAKAVTNAHFCEFGCEQGACLKTQIYGSN